MITACIIYNKEREEEVRHCIKSLPDYFSLCIVRTIPDYDYTDIANRLNPFEDITGRFESVRYDVFMYNADDFSFGQARNFCKKMAETDWLLQIDSDERIIFTEEDLELIKTLSLDYAGVNVVVVSSIKKDLETSIVVDVQPRLLRNLDGIVYEYRIHENANRSIKELGLKIYSSDIIIRHVGYKTEIMNGKLRRNMMGMMKDLMTEPSNKHLLTKLKQTIEAELSK